MQHTDHRNLLHENVVRLCWCVGAAGRPDYKDAALRYDAAHRGFEHFATNRVVDNVHSAATRDGLDTFAHILVPVIHDVIGTETTHDIELCVVPTRGDHSCAEGLAELDSGSADAAGGTVHQQRLAGFQSGTINQGVVARRVGCNISRGLDETQTVRHRSKERNVCRDLFGEKADRVAWPGDDHLLTNAPILDVRACFHDDARGFHPRYEWEFGLELVTARDHQDVWKIEPAGLERDPHLARPRAP